MKSFTAIVFGFVAAALVAAQTPDISSLPQCALTCATTAIGSASTYGCSSTNYKCICTSQSFIGSIETCIKGACNATEQQETLTFAEGFCAQVGVTIPASAYATAAPSSTPSATATSSGVVYHTSAPSTNATSSGTSGNATKSGTPPVSTATSNSAAMFGVSGLSLGAAFAAFLLL
ncbi:hypothetical protein RUND412_001575 [Rhizina undulata]